MCPALVHSVSALNAASPRTCQADQDLRLPTIITRDELELCTRRAAAVYNVPERPSSADTLESTHGTRIGALDARTQNLRHCDTMDVARAQILPSLARRNDMFVDLSFPPTILLQHVQSGLLWLRTSTMSKSCNWWRIPWQFSNRRDYRIVKAGLNDNQVDHTSLT